MTTPDPLLPDRHKQLDFFVCDLLDAMPKGDMGSMEHPVFSLSIKPDMSTWRYEHGHNWIEIIPSAIGRATVFDRDILIFCIGQCVAALNEGREISRTVQFTAKDLLVATNRQTSGQGYKLLEDAFQRLQGTQIRTNVYQGGYTTNKIFGIVDSAGSIREGLDGRMIEAQVELSKWLYEAVRNRHVLTLNRRYFQLRKPLERRLYELARKHCGKQQSWQIGLETLQAKCGAMSPARKFKYMLSQIIVADLEHDHMPDYSFEIVGKTVVVKPKTPPAPGQSLLLKPETYDKARQIAPGWDVYMLETEWRTWVAKKNKAVRSPDEFFLAFCRKRGPHDKRYG